MKKLAALLVGKSIFKTTRLLKLGGGFAAPGLYALKLDSNLVEKLINHKAKNIIVTGTNGKTTTSSLLSHFLNASGHKVTKNSSGSNLERGIASYLINQSNFKGKLDYDFGVWEVDEFAFNSLAPKIRPNAIILLNAFRDQLDRYGEVNTVIERWQKTLSKLSSETLVVVNSDDQNLMNALKDFKGKVTKIGIKGSKISGENLKESKTKPDYEAEVLNTSSLEQTDLKVTWNSTHQEKFTLPLPGVFNAYNFLASFTLSHLLNLDVQKIKDSSSLFKPSFGRFERFEINNKQASIFLIKNPVGATAVFQTILPHIKPSDSLLTALNDNFADGTDVSWIWDIGLENLPSNLKSKIINLRFYVSGNRAYDMALRLKYAGINLSNLQTNVDLTNSFDDAISKTKGKLFILPTYTALLELQKLLVKKGVKQEYWKD